MKKTRRLDLTVAGVDEPVMCRQRGPIVRSADARWAKAPSCFTGIRYSRGVQKGYEADDMSSVEKICTILEPV